MSFNEKTSKMVHTMLIVYQIKKKQNIDTNMGEYQRSRSIRVGYIEGK